MHQVPSPAVVATLVRLTPDRLTPDRLTLDRLTLDAGGHRPRYGARRGTAAPR
ncbi:MAG TPA: hypothetical protein VF657_11110 [Actinoplanes sp.]